MMAMRGRKNISGGGEAVYITPEEISFCSNLLVVLALQIRLQTSIGLGTPWLSMVLQETYSISSTVATPPRLASGADTRF
jgi:hypothetical protein